ncbi:hypothetical protein [Sphingomonas alba]|uniref:LPXTG cell wall anchor domain-containing protein n=1 Tax=Sphingomonas alba TaxID=2908208 RepID=A0ABT0RN77_9SPHN|nr:hypothetical protein [Sphingomonas alba]MCL6684106.1 hypothetical protein [Sphingomonas alba]
MPVVRREVSDRTAFGKVVKWTFILFNILMLGLLLLSCKTNSDAIANASSQAEYADAATAGATIGAGLVSGTLIFLWLAGAVILGLFVLFTRRKKIIETEE